MATLVDSHVHLDRYTDEEAKSMVARGAAAGVARLLTIGVDLATSRAALDLAARHPSILAAVGIHPTRLSAPSPPDPLSHAWERGRPSASPELSPPPHCDGEGVGGWGLLPGLRALLDQQPAAIGEVGLDAGAPDLEAQQRFLDACLGLAADRGLPVVLHVVGERAVHEAALAIVGRHPTVRTVAHYFVGGRDLARRYLEHGCWISVGRPATRPAEAAVRAAIPTIPLDRLLLETDTYPLPGRTTEPQDVATVCAAVAELTGRPYEEIAEATTASFDEFLAGQQTS
jgi:TatD DNase family protein